MLSPNGKCKNTAKGVKKNIIKKGLTHKDYNKDTIKQKKMIAVMHRIGLLKHEIFTFVNNKRIVFFDDIRSWLNGNESLPYDH